MNKRIWRDCDKQAAAIEGWEVYSIGPYPVIERLIQGNPLRVTFHSTIRVWSHVVEQALRNSELHLRALCVVTPGLLHDIRRHCGPRGQHLCLMILNERAERKMLFEMWGAR